MSNTAETPTLYQRKHCPKCGSSDINRTRRKTWEKWLSPFLALKAYRCIDCNKRFLSTNKS